MTILYACFDIPSKSTLVVIVEHDDMTNYRHDRPPKNKGVDSHVNNVRICQCRTPNIYVTWKFLGSYLDNHAFARVPPIQ